MKLRHQNQQIALILVVFLFILLLSLLRVDRFVRNQTWFLNLKLFSQEQASRLKAPFSLVDYYFQQKTDMAWLKQAYFNSQARLVKLEELEAQNQKLKKLLEVKSDTDKPILLVASVYSQSQPLVSAGSEEGLKPGSLVFADQVFLGVIDQVEPHTATVKLLTEDPNLKLLAKTESGVSGLVRMVDGQLKLTEIPADLVVKKHESVYTAGQPGIPPKLFIGIVAKEPQVDSAPTYEVLLDAGTSFYQQPIIKVIP